MSFSPLWESILDNLKMHRLPMETVGKWTWMLACARRHDRDNGTLPDLETLSFWLRHSEQEVKAWLDELVAARLVDRQGKTHAIHDWQQWQYASKDPKAKERMRRWRERQKNQGENGEAERNVQRNVTEPVTNRYGNVTGATNKRNIKTIPPNPPEGVDEVVNFGRTTMGDRFDLEHIGEKLAGWRAAEYPDSWIRDAILVAHSSAAPGRTPAYILGCLRRWKIRGSPDPAEIVKAQAKAAAAATVTYTVARPGFSLGPPKGKS